MVRRPPRSTRTDTLVPDTTCVRSEGAADLAGDAERASVLLGDVDRLDLLAVGKAEQPLARAVLGDLGQGDVRTAHRAGRGQALAEVLGKGGHGGEVGFAAMVDPVPELLGAERLFAELGHGCRDRKSTR